MEVIDMKQNISSNTFKVVTKVEKHFFPDFNANIQKITDPRKDNIKYPLSVLIHTQILNFLTFGQAQRRIEKQFHTESFFKNLSRLSETEQLEKIFDAEVLTDTFSKLKVREVEKLRDSMAKRIFRNKVLNSEKVYGYFNVLIDATRFQKAHYEVSPEWLHMTHEGVTTWYLAVEEAKIIGKEMSISIGTEMIKNEDGSTKQDCEINAFKRLAEKLKQNYPKLKIRILGDSLYACEPVIKICKKNNWEYLIVLKETRLPSIMEQYLELVWQDKDNIVWQEDKEKIKVYQWVNGIDNVRYKTNILEEITYYKTSKEQTRWIWMTNREITRRNVEILARTGRKRSYIENQGFKEQKSGCFNLEHVYSKNYNAIQVIYLLLQIAHMLLQIIEHSDIVGNFRKKYGSVRDFSLQLLIYLTQFTIRETEYSELLEQKIQIRFQNSL